MLYVSWSRKRAAMAPIKSSLKVGNCHLFDFNRSFKSTETEDEIQTKTFGSLKLTSEDSYIYSRLPKICNDDRSPSEDCRRLPEDFQKFAGRFEDVKQKVVGNWRSESERIFSRIAELLSNIFLAD